MAVNRQEVMADVLAAIQKKWGTQALRTGSEIALSAALAPLPTGFIKMDALLDGGIRHGQITEFCGTHTSGVTTLALKTIASAQAKDNRVVFIDLASAFNPRYAFDFGVRLQDLLIVRPENLREGLDIAAELMNRWSVDLLVFGHSNEREDRSTAAALKRLVSAVRHSDCAFITLNRNARSELSPLHVYSASRLYFYRTHWLERWGQVGGYLVKVHVVKLNGRDVNREVTLRLDLPGGMADE